MRHRSWLTGIAVLFCILGSCTTTSRKLAHATAEAGCASSSKEVLASERSRSEIFASLVRLHDCVGATTRPMTSFRRPSGLFWTVLLDLAGLSAGLALLVRAAIGTPSRSLIIWMSAVATSIPLLFLVRDIASNASIIAHHERRFRLADARWQIDMIRAGRIIDDDEAIDAATVATERFAHRLLQP